MGARLVMRDKPGERGRNVVDLATSPCCAVLAQGLGGRTQAVFHSQYALVLDDRPVRASTADKPAYKVPTMKAIRRRKRNGYTVISTFAAGGGSTTGYKMAGFQVIAAVEWLERAAETYRANHPDTPVIVRDVREVPGPELLELAGLKRGELDVLDGSPPCEPFSSAGKRDKGWSGDQDLFYEYARLVDEIRPRVFVAENVAGLVRGRAKGYYKRIHAKLSSLGYRVEARLLDAQWLGVPQTRQRLIFVGVREDLGVDPAFPSPLAYRYTVREALPHIFRHGLQRERGGGPNARVPRFDEGSADSGEEPHPTVLGRGNTHGTVGWVEEDATIQSGAAPRKRRSVDEPSPAVMAGRTADIDDPSVVYDERRAERAEQDVTDQPAPTVRAGGGPNPGRNVGDLSVDEPVVVHDPKGPRTRRRDVTDQPAPTVTVGGNEANHNVGANSHHYQVEEPVDDDIERVEIRRGGDRIEEGFDPATEPSQAVTTRSNRWQAVGRNRRRRRLTIDEVKAICSFPPDYELVGTYGEQWERLGDAVPPVMMAAVAREVAGILSRADRA